jgi:hypothetical protein
VGMLEEEEINPHPLLLKLGNQNLNFEGFKKNRVGHFLAKQVYFVSSIITG